MANPLSCVKNYDPELRKIIQWVKALASRARGPLVIVEVGCGNGRLLKPLSDLKKAGHDVRVIGVDVNSESIRLNRSAGLECHGPEGFTGLNLKCDLLIMSHLIEHFAPNDLLKFMDSYLDFVKPGGSLLIATPLQSKYFYDDFDHVRPYQPAGIMTVFGPSQGQLQFASRNLLKLERLWFRRGQLRILRHTSLYLPCAWSWVRFINFAGSLLYWITCGCLGKVDGWVGLFRVEGPRSK